MPHPARPVPFPRLPLGALLLAPLAALGLGCGDGGGGDTAVARPPIDRGPATPAVTATPASGAVTTAQALAVTVTVGGGGAGAPTPDGTVTLSSGGYTSAAQPLSGGAATLTVPAGVLALGTPTLAVRYAPGAGTAASYAAAATTASVTVTAAPSPSVTASSTSIGVNGHPFVALPVGANGLLVSVSSNGNSGSQTGLAAFTGSGSAFTYACTQPAAYPNNAGATLAFGQAQNPAGTALALAVDDAGLVLFDPRAVLNGCTGTAQPVSQGAVASRQGSFDVTVTPDGRFAFVANEYGVAAGGTTQGNVGVVALRYDAAGAVSGGTLLGQIATGGQAVAGVTLSPDGTRLYVTSEVAASGTAFSGSTNATLAHAGCAQAANAPTTANGLLTVIDVARATASPGPGAILATVAAGCSPVRAAVTRDGEVVWVAARGDNRVLAFGARTLEAAPDAALLGFGDTGGAAPVGLALFNGDRLLGVANSNRFASPAAVGNFTVMQAVAVAPGVVQTVAAGYFPRSVTVAPDDATLYLTDYSSGTVQAIATTTSR